MSQPIPDVVQQVDSAFYWIGGICAVLLVGVTVAMIAFIARFHRGRQPDPTSRSEGNLVLEVTWIVIPTLIVLFMFWLGYTGFRSMRAVPPGAMVVQVTGQRWSWNFRYPEQDISSPVLYVPVDTPVKLEITAPASDVVHGFYIPSFRVKEDAVPGRMNHLWFRADREGTHNVFCTVFCGQSHSAMITKMIVLSKKGYQDWLAAKIADRNKPVVIEQAMDPGSPDIVARDGKKLFLTYCAGCHGAEGRGTGIVGARNFTSLDGWKRSPKLTDIYRTISDGLDGTQMRPFTNIPPWDRFALMHQVASFYTAGGRPASTPEDVAKLRADYKLDEVPKEVRRIPVEQAMRAIVEDARKKK